MCIARLLVFGEAMFGQLLVLCAWLSIVGKRPDADASARRKQSGDLDVFGLHEGDEVLHDDVYAVFVEVAVVAKTEKIEFQALAFNHSLGWDVADAYLGKVGLTRDGAERREFGTIKSHPVVVFGMLVLESFEHFGGIVVAILGFRAERFEALRLAVVVVVHC